jgi:hypothetical protein
VTLVLTLLARDEADILDAHLSFHLNAGVDHVVATDHRSTDGTTEILERYARDGVLHLFREDAAGFDQSAWVTRMARFAARELCADWVINSDADEFWWPRGSSLKELLGAVPPRYGVVRAPIRHFFLRPPNGHFFSERMVVRPLLGAPVNKPESPLRPNTHVIHRADPRLTVSAGNHAVHGVQLAPLPGWHPIEVLHFPLRSIQQARQKYENWVDSLAGREYRDAFEAHERGELGAYVDAQVLEDDVLERGLSDGSLVEDTRLREALRALAGRAPVPDSIAAEALRAASQDGRLSFPQPSLADDACYAAEIAVLAEADLVRLLRRLDELELRLARLEQGRLRRSARRLATSRRRLR